MQKWEYLFIHVYNDRVPILSNQSSQVKEIPIFDYADSLGEQGWELIGTISSHDSNLYKLIFKRPKPQSP